MATLVLLMGSVACGPLENAGGPIEAPLSREQALAGDNGLSINGLSINGLSINGLSINGLSINGLASADFSSWFAQDAALNAGVMQYVVKCAVPEGESRSYQDPSTGASYTWQGLLGLAPGWASGQRITEAEEQLVSACLAAHVNKYGMHVPLSVLGRTAQQQSIPYTAEELQSFPRREGCFFGNLFRSEGLFAGTDGAYLNDDESSPRACGLTTPQDAQGAQCSPLGHVGSCEAFCTLDPSGVFYTECTYNGRTYLPLTTRIRSEDVYSCGDGVCQFTESCGTGTQASSCLSDCGACE
ncbi:MAG: hypothetical protein JXB05_21290 [Myxococcaceae bacterium]|nr:hypothetical protein [Myxococcaceae bacterium]